MAAKYIGLGVIQQMDSNADNTYETIALVVSGTPPGRARELVDFTTLDATLAVYEPGIEKHSQYSFDFCWDPDDVNQASLYTLFGSKAKVNWKVTYTDSTPATNVFVGFVSDIEILQVEHNKPLMKRCVVQRTGDITVA